MSDNFIYKHPSASPSLRGPQIESWISDNPSFAEQVKIFKRYESRIQALMDHMQSEIDAAPDHDAATRVRKKWWSRKIDPVVLEYEREVSQFGVQAISWNRMIAMNWPGED